MGTFLNRRQVWERWEISSDFLNHLEFEGRPDPDTYVQDEGYPLEVIERIEAEDRRKKILPCDFRNPVKTAFASASLRAQIASKPIFSGHISSAGALARGFGLVMWEINRIVRRQIKEKFDQPMEFFLNSRYADRLCAHPKKAGCQTLASCLVACGILESVGAPVVGFLNTKYRLSEAWLGICPRNLNRWQVDRLKRVRRFYQSQHEQKYPWVKHVDATLSVTILPDSPQRAAALAAENTRPSTQWVIDVLEAYHRNPGQRGTMCKFAQTTYPPIGSLPSYLVPTLRIENEEVAQLDISSAHPCTLVRLLIDVGAKVCSVGAAIEACRLREALESGTLYIWLGAECGIATEVAKLRLLSALNGKNGHTYNDAVFKAFARRFPITRRVIALMRSKDRKRLSRWMAKILSDSVNEALMICMDKSIPVIPRTDELVCKRSDAETVRLILSECFFKHAKVNPVVGGVRLPIGISTPEQVPPVQINDSEPILSLTITEQPAVAEDLKEWFSHFVCFCDMPTSQFEAGIKKP
jgi:hypothetical protein